MLTLFLNIVYVGQLVGAAHQTDFVILNVVQIVELTLPGAGLANINEDVLQAVGGVDLYYLLHYYGY